MDYEAARFWLETAIFLASAGAWVYAWNVGRRAADRSKVDRMGAELAALAETVRNKPGHEDLGRIYEKVNGLHGDIKGVEGELKGIAHQLGMIVNHLLEGKRQ